MLTRAYDAIMAATQVPMITYQNVDFSSTNIDDSTLSCKDYGGAVRTCASCCALTTGGQQDSVSAAAADTPFAYWGRTDMVPDEDGSEPNYEDYEADDGTQAGWQGSSTAYTIDKKYDESTKEFVCTAKYKWQNASGAAKTVYGVKVLGSWRYRNLYASTATTTTRFLLCREHFPSPVEVEDQGIIQLTFTWRVGRAGLVSNTSADGDGETT